MDPFGFEPLPYCEQFLARGDGCVGEDTGALCDQARGHVQLDDFHGCVAGDFEFSGLRARHAECFFLVRGEVGVGQGELGGVGGCKGFEFSVEGVGSDLALFLLGGEAHYGGFVDLEVTVVEDLTCLVVRGGARHLCRIVLFEDDQRFGYDGVGVIHCVKNVGQLCGGEFSSHKGNELVCLPRVAVEGIGVEVEGHYVNVLVVAAVHSCNVCKLKICVVNITNLCNTIFPNL